VELDVVGIHAMHRTLHLGEQAERSLGTIAHARRDVGGVDEVADGRVRPMAVVTLVTLETVETVETAVTLIVIVIVIAVAVVVTMVEQRVIVLAQYGDVCLGGGDAAPQYRLECQRISVER
jgi:hypothetical protein